MPSLLEQLRAQRTTAREAADAILERARVETRDLTPEEWTDYSTRTTELRSVDDAIEAERDREVAELRAATVRQPGPALPREPVLTREQSVHDWLQTHGAFIPEQAEGLSFDRYLRGMATGRWDEAPQERSLAEATIGAGGALVPAPLSARVIDLARNASRVFQAGSITVPMTAQTLALARLTGEGTPGWKTENSAITATADMTFDRVTFTARTLTRVITLSLELFEDADPSSQDVIARSFAAQMALELDRVALRGSGTAPEPRGVLNQSGITTTAHGANGSVIGSPPAAGTIGWEFLAQAAGTVRTANFRAERTGHGAPDRAVARPAPRHDQPVHRPTDLPERHHPPPDQAGPHQPDGRHQLGLLGGLHRAVGPVHGRHPHRLQPPVPRGAVPRRQLAVRLPGVPPGGHPARPADRVRGGHWGERLMAAPKVEHAAEDLLIERDDLGPESFTLIVKGEVIPLELAKLPRKPRDAKPKG
jgi:HK97 family phage major capsid protein